MKKLLMVIPYYIWYWLLDYVVAPRFVIEGDSHNNMPMYRKIITVRTILTYRKSDATEFTWFQARKQLGYLKPNLCNWRIVRLRRI